MCPIALSVTPQVPDAQADAHRGAGMGASLRGGALTQLRSRKFVAKYKVDMSEEADPRIESSPPSTSSSPGPCAKVPGRSPTRRSSARWMPHQPVRPDRARPDLPGQGPQLFQPARWVGATRPLAHQFDHGTSRRSTLAPKDYHRSHAVRRRLKRMIYIPATCFSVIRSRRATCPACFARNERVACVLHAYGPFVQRAGGATIVRQHGTVWHGVVNPPRTAASASGARDENIVLAKARRWGVFCWFHHRHAVPEERGDFPS